MATTSRTESADAASALADCLREAAFVRVVARRDGDALAAAGLIARACAARETPFQASLAATRGAAADALAAVADADATVAVGFDLAADATLDGDGLAATAFDAVSDAAGAPERALALAGVRAAGDAPTGPLSEGVERRPGVGLPVADLADGLAHTTRLHASWSGDERRAGALLAELDLPAELDADARRRLASRVALDASENASPRAVGALAGALRPHVLADGPFETVEGYADVLDCLAVGAPGLASALALGSADRADALAAWRTHATATHEAFRRADPARYSGLVVCEADAPAWPLARLLRDSRSPEPAALVVGESGAALACVPDGPHARDALAATVDRDAVSGSATRAWTTETDVETLREGVRGAP